jgi:hypothetical protein
MNFAEFEASLDYATPPPNLGRALEALWWEAKGDWNKAHQLAQAQDDKDGAWVHAYLHRVEGDEGNAGYWYRRAGKHYSTDPLKDEWRAIAANLLGA